MVRSLTSKALMCSFLLLAVAFWPVRGEAFREQAARGKDSAALIVVGKVRDTYRSTRPEAAGFLVQIEVGRAEAGRYRGTERLIIPAAGEQIYVHSTANPPPVGSTGRAYLDPHDRGGWEGASADWFDQDPSTAGGAGDAAPRRGEASAGGRPKADLLQSLGLEAEQVSVSGRLVLKVGTVQPDSPAGNAGIEPGDVIIGVEGAAFTSLAEFAEALRRGAPQPKLVILDVRKGRQANVPIAVDGLAGAEEPRTRPMPEPAPTPAPSPSPTPSRVTAGMDATLGLRAEPVRIGLGFQKGLKVVELADNGPAKEAGLEIDDVIVSVNDARVSEMSELSAAAQKAGPMLTLNVRDKNTGRVVPVPVHIGRNPQRPAPEEPRPKPETPAPKPAPAPSPTNTPSSASARSLGMTVQAGTVDLLPVVKVVRVEPGSPAEKAGIEPGDAIVGLNDHVIFAPDLLDEAIKKAGSGFTLTVVDHKTNRRAPVKLEVGQ